MHSLSGAPPSILTFMLSAHSASQRPLRLLWKPPDKTYRSIPNDTRGDPTIRSIWVGRENCQSFTSQSHSSPLRCFSFNAQVNSSSYLGKTLSSAPCAVCFLSSHSCSFQCYQVSF
ncbi:hypothetical protein CC80DRAFT_121801 [Byssothecium circinans]|uniref:Uncharacterized protein n=1 Tax=Byssothecium circinans TaxID=147558 RepID=A0A6A5U082_9PLEO|nr:hypothetical protein CC80DRAFT_121801 [Byssothecium circinans]